MSSFRDWAKSSYAGRLILIPWRLKNALRELTPGLAQAFVWAFQSREHYNFTYDLTPLNEEHMAAFVAVVTGTPIGIILDYMRELKLDAQLREHVIRFNRESRERYVADPTAKFGRRMGWYAILRALKPKLAVETGVDKGLGSCVIAAALLRNRAEGFPGRLIGIDINANAGYLIRGPYAEVATVAYGDSIHALKNLNELVDFFIHDSDHSADHEAMEFAAIQSKLSPSAIVLSDNAYITSELLKFARRTHRSFLFFQEEPANHWWPGDGIGVAFTPPRLPL